ncbi:MAG: hypothetical protein IJW16_06440 [Clostridia bacterium]|nr:hypothetical protein [Clostridia bacterium]
MKRTKLLSLFLTVAILAASVILVVPTTADSGANPTIPTPTSTTEETVPTTPPTESWYDHMAHTFANGIRLGQAGYGTERQPYPISSAEELAYFSWLVNRGPGYNMSGLYFTLTADIDLSAYLWEPIARAYSASNAYDYDGDGTKDTFQQAFGGVFDGGGYTISGLNFTNNNLGADGKLSPYYGGLSLFGTLRGASSAAPAIIRNLNIVGSAKITDYNYVTSNFGAPITMLATAAYSNVSVSNVNVTTDMDISCKAGNILVAGLIGYQTAGAEVENCTVSGEINVDNTATAVATLAGGFAARTNGTATILNSINNANVTVSTTSNTAFASGFVAKIEGNDYVSGDVEKLEIGVANLLAISGCVNNGNITVNNYAGGSGTILTAVGACLGMAGSNDKGDAYVVNCINTGLLQADNMGPSGGVAAMIGVQRTERCAVENCYSTTQPVCTNAEEVASRGFEASFVYTYGALRITNDAPYIAVKWLTPEGCLFLPEKAVTVTPGAALRRNPTPGRENIASLRFEGKLDADFLDMMEGKKLDYGFLLIDAKLAAEAAVNVRATKDMMKLLDGDAYRRLSPLTAELEEDNLFHSIVTNIKADGYATEYVIVGYVSLILDPTSGHELMFYSDCLVENRDDGNLLEQTFMPDPAYVVSVKEVAQLYYNLRSDVADAVNVNEVGEAHRVEGLGNFSQFTDAELDLFKNYFTDPAPDVDEDPAPDEGDEPIVPDPTPDPTPDPDVDTDMDEVVEGGNNDDPQ